MSLTQTLHSREFTFANQLPYYKLPGHDRRLRSARSGDASAASVNKENRGRDIDSLKDRIYNKDCKHLFGINRCNDYLFKSANV